MGFQLNKLIGVAQVVLTVKGATGDTGLPGVAGSGPNCFFMNAESNLTPAVYISSPNYWTLDGNGDLESA